MKTCSSRDFRFCLVIIPSHTGRRLSFGSKLGMDVKICSFISPLCFRWASLCFHSILYVLSRIFITENARLLRGAPEEGRETSSQWLRMHWNKFSVFPSLVRTPWDISSDYHCAHMEYWRVRLVRTWLIVLLEGKVI